MFVIFFLINGIQILVIPQKKTLKNMIIRHPEITEQDKWSCAGFILQIQCECICVSFKF